MSDIKPASRKSIPRKGTSKRIEEARHADTSSPAKTKTPQSKSTYFPVSSSSGASKGSRKSSASDSGPSSRTTSGDLTSSPASSPSSSSSRGGASYGQSSDSGTPFSVSRGSPTHKFPDPPKAAPTSGSAIDLEDDDLEIEPKAALTPEEGSTAKFTGLSEEQRALLKEVGAVLWDAAYIGGTAGATSVAPGIALSAASAAFTAARPALSAAAPAVMSLLAASSLSGPVFEYVAGKIGEKITLPSVTSTLGYAALGAVTLLAAGSFMVPAVAAGLALGAPAAGSAMATAATAALGGEAFMTAVESALVVEFVCQVAPKTFSEFYALYTSKDSSQDLPDSGAEQSSLEGGVSRAELVDVMAKGNPSEAMALLGMAFAQGNTETLKAADEAGMVIAKEFVSKANKAMEGETKATPQEHLVAAAATTATTVAVVAAGAAATGIDPVTLSRIGATAFRESAVAVGGMEPDGVITGMQKAVISEVVTETLNGIGVTLSDVRGVLAKDLAKQVAIKAFPVAAKVAAEGAAHMLAEQVGSSKATPIAVGVGALVASGKALATTGRYALTAAWWAVRKCAELSRE